MKRGDMMTKSEKIIELTNHYGAHNYLPLPIVISEAEGVWVKDPEGNKYMDMLSAYSLLTKVIDIRKLFKH